jgi:hypothetical protein
MNKAATKTPAQTSCNTAGEKTKFPQEYHRTGKHPV